MSIKFDVTMTSLRWSAASCRRQSIVVFCTFLISVSTLTTTVLIIVGQSSCTYDRQMTVHKPFHGKPQHTDDYDFSIDADTASSHLVTSHWNDSDSSALLAEMGIFWSFGVDKLIPSGLMNDDLQKLIATIQRTPVKSLEPAEWNRCGRPLNKYVTLRDGTTLCARYRHPDDSLILGELLSYYLSRLLQLDSVPISVLSRISDDVMPWTGYNVTSSGWQTGRVVSLTQWVPAVSNLRSLRVKIPNLLLQSYTRGRPMSRVDLERSRLTDGELLALVQWTDLVLFDYITGHYDRVASVQDDVEQHWNVTISTDSYVRNLLADQSTGKLWLIDNESGLLDAYVLLYGPNSATQGGHKFLHFHEKMLKSTCIFRQQTINRLVWLSSQRSPSKTLESLAAANDKLYGQFEQVTDLHLFRKHFHVRLKQVLRWVKKCARIHQDTNITLTHPSPLGIDDERLY